jgi:hypothetical protein
MSEGNKLIQEVADLMSGEFGDGESNYLLAMQIIELVRDSEWVSIDTPPESSCEVILVFKDGSMGFDRYDHERETFDFDEYKEHIENGGGWVTSPTHWAIRPSPPTNKGDK